MSYTKKEIIELAFEEIGLANYNFDLQPEQFQTGLKRLDLMMATWNKKGIRIGYPISSSPLSDTLNDNVEVRDSALEAMYLNLATRIATPFGKVLSQDSKAHAHSTYLDVLRDTSVIQERGFTTLGAGAGNKPWRYYGQEAFLRKKPDTLDGGQDGEINLN